MPSRRQVRISQSSSSVPRPPGSTRNASARRAIQANTGPAVDQPPAALGDGSPQRLGGFKKKWVAAITRGAEDTNAVLCMRLFFLRRIHCRGWPPSLRVFSRVTKHAPSRAPRCASPAAIHWSLKKFPPRRLPVNPLLEKMNPQQRAAVGATEGPGLILGGAGSGKTRVITHRIAYLIEAKGVAPDSILAVTFTNKASAEMGERVNKLLAGSTLAKPLLSTFHSFCVRVLRRDIEALRIGDQGRTRSFAIYDESDQQAIVKQAMRRMSVDDKTLPPSTVRGKISWAKNHIIDPQEYYLGSSDPISERVAQLYEVYRKELLKNNALDFDDLLLETVRLLKASGETRELQTPPSPYIMIDEYQDTNRPQYEMMKLLAGDHHNICVVGDEDQSIYSWRGADIAHILE